MTWLSIAWFFAKELFTGEVYRIWRNHKANEKAQAVANAPLTDKEWEEDAKNGDL